MIVFLTDPRELFASWRARLLLALILGAYREDRIERIRRTLTGRGGE